jgi:kumamolisin
VKARINEIRASTVPHFTNSMHEHKLFAVGSHFRLTAAFDTASFQKNSSCTTLPSGGGEMGTSKKGLALLIGAAIMLGISQLALAQLGGTVSIPPSNVPADRHHVGTSYRIFTPVAGNASLSLNAKMRGATATSGASPATTGSAPWPEEPYQTPASLACIYGLVGTPGTCNPNAVFTNSTGGSKLIAIVDAYDYPNALSDLQAFSAQFGLPIPNNTNFTVVYASGSQPVDGASSGWQEEEALDIEWAHAMAPNAKIVLVEAASNSLVDMYAAVVVASNLVNAAGGGEVSMSWSAGEYSGETNDDVNFTTAKVVYLAASGDYPGTGYPCVSPDVVCVGGTTLRESVTYTPGYATYATGNFLQEVAWTEGGGGLSQYEARPAYQSKISSIVGSARGVPDVSAAADPYNGAWVLWTYTGQLPTWYIVGGTSWATPVMAGIINAAGGFSASSTAELTKIYAAAGTAAFRDIIDGWCSAPTYTFSFLVGAYANSAAKGWDVCTGVGSPLGKTGK